MTAIEDNHSEEAMRAAAKDAKLRYVTDMIPGIRREGDTKHGFRYYHPDGSEVDDPKNLERIKSLALPPAYTDVWICPYPGGHLQATGRDDKGRKQYRYHPRWRAVRDETKFDRMPAFGNALPHLRSQVDTDLKRRDLPREKVLATVITLLEATLIRVGNEEYAKANRSYGLTTMRDRHIKLEGSQVRFQFMGKSGKRHRLAVKSKRLARIVQQCRDLPGQELFQYLDPETGERHPVTSGEVNAYLREVMGQDFTAKDFRTWAATLLCALALQSESAEGAKAEVQHRINDAVASVAERLGNTAAICRKSYIHPAVIDSFLAGDLASRLCAGKKTLEGMSEDEARVLAFLRGHSCA